MSNFTAKRTYSMDVKLHLLYTSIACNTSKLVNASAV